MGKKTDIETEKQPRTLQEIIESYSLGIPIEQNIIDEFNKNLESGYECFINDVVYDAFNNFYGELIRDCLGEWIIENFKLQIVRK